MQLQLGISLMSEPSFQPHLTSIRGSSNYTLLMKNMKKELLLGKLSHKSSPPDGNGD